MADLTSYHLHTSRQDEEQLRRRDGPTSGLNGQGDCEAADPADTVTDRLNNLLSSKGEGYTLHLCPSSNYVISAPVKFAAPNQEISTYGYPTDDSRATLVVMGPVDNGDPHTVAVDGTCGQCDGVKLRNIQINGTRNGHPPTTGGGNIEFGGDNSGQLIEFVHSFDPRGWTCLHIAEGPFTCNNVTIRNNDIGPCGSDLFQQWADGISVSCQNSVIRDNIIRGPTDGGIVLFGAPGTLVENNTISAENNTLLGGINMVDYDPWQGNYTNTIVRNNIILGGFATETPGPGETKGENNEDVIIKIGIAIGPRTWFADRFQQKVAVNGQAVNNRLTGAFGYGIAVTSATNFTVEGNVLFGNTTFIGSRGPNCSTTDITPSPNPFVVQQNNTQNSKLQGDFQAIPDGDGLTCILPPDGGDYWPFGGNPNGTQSGNGHGNGNSGSHSHGSGALSAGSKAGIAIGVIFTLLALGLATYLIRRRAVTAQRRRAAMQSGRFEPKDFR